ncbi:alpha/beta-hydrolase [Coprinopsis marcescibilis]|uniref:Alpha/beta-hydrolase n=1 Tax=Coprinopsis marcescibilis TaxID=230819 RepID=A0A5C3KNL9_COPMA|nr:alpha/beta-hydrolase [Coprinopsis marcescibilis]
MPRVAVNPPAGPATFEYTISTPTCPDANAIDSSVPTVIFVHPVYIGRIVWHPQLSDPKLRRFNLVTFDLRGHGGTDGDIPLHYRRPEAGEDVYSFMKALNLPPSHIVGISMGACIALEFTATHPDMVLSSTMIAPLPLEEPAEVLEGRQEILDCWKIAAADPDNLDQEALMDALTGSVQLATNGVKYKVAEAMTQIAVKLAMKHAAGEKVEQQHTITVKFFQDRKPHPIEVLQRVKTPISLIHCGADIAYPIEFAEELHQRLEKAGLNARLVSVPGAPHFGSITHYTDVNPILHDFILEQSKSSTMPPAPATVVSPFEELFAELGCAELGAASDDDDADDDFFISS